MVIFQHCCNKMIFGRESDGVFLRVCQVSIGEATSYMEEPICATKWIQSSKLGVCSMLKEGEMDVLEDEIARLEMIDSENGRTRRFLLELVRWVRENW